jgi:putative ABC transport system ATP-binding protein
LGGHVQTPLPRRRNPRRRDRARRLFRQLLLRDEHLAALDPNTAALVLQLTIDLVAEMRCATIMITHDMEHALRTGTRLLVMSHGRIVVELPEERKNGMTTQDLIDLMEPA